MPEVSSLTQNGTKLNLKRLEKCCAFLKAEIHFIKYKRKNKFDLGSLKSIKKVNIDLAQPVKMFSAIFCLMYFVPFSFLFIFYYRTESYVPTC